MKKQKAKAFERKKCVGCGRWVQRLVWTADSEGLLKGDDGLLYASPMNAEGQGKK